MDYFGSEIARNPDTGEPAGPLTVQGLPFMPAPQSGSPMTCMLDGEQYIVLAVSGSNYSGELLAFKLN